MLLMNFLIRCGTMKKQTIYDRTGNSIKDIQDAVAKDKPRSESQHTADQGSNHHPPTPTDEVDLARQERTDRDKELDDEERIGNRGL